MRQVLFAAAIGCCLPSALCAGDLKLGDGTTVLFATQQEAAQILAAEDEFIQRTSPFDRAARMKTDRAVTKEDLRAFAAANALDWNPTDQVAVELAVKMILPKLAGLTLRLPKVILMVQTTGKEEGDTAYTRGNAIILPQSLVGASLEDLQRNITHELFHICTRHNPKLREALYAAIGFLPCNEIEFPAELAPQRLTNPDAPKNDHYILVTLQGKPLSVVPILHASARNYDAQRGGEFFEHMTFGLLAVEKGQTGWKPLLRDGRAVLLEPKQVSMFFEQIGRNTQYVLHPEEILADNFTLIVQGKKGLPSPEVSAKIETLLRTGVDAKPKT